MLQRGASHCWAACVLGAVRHRPAFCYGSFNLSSRSTCSSTDALHQLLWSCAGDTPPTREHQFFGPINVAHIAGKAQLFGWTHTLLIMVIDRLACMPRCIQARAGAS